MKLFDPLKHKDDFPIDEKLLEGHNNVFLSGVHGIIAFQYNPPFWGVMLIGEDDGFWHKCRDVEFDSFWIPDLHIVLSRAQQWIGRAKHSGLTMASE